MGPPSTLGEKYEKMLVVWIGELAKRGFPIVKWDLISSVEKIVRDMGISNKFNNGRPGKKWFKLFLQRNKEIAKRTVEKLTKNRASVTPAMLRNWFHEVRSYLTENDLLSVMENPERIFNMDESGFMLCPKGEKVLGLKGQKNVYEVCGKDKEQCTILLATSASGLLAPTLIVYSGQRLPKGVGDHMPDGWGLAKSEKGWITGEVFYEYIANVFYPWIKKKEIALPVILFVDGHSSHLTYHLSNFCNEVGIVIVALNPNATHIIQPLDVSVFGPLKKKWTREVHKWRMENSQISINKLQLPKLLHGILQNDLHPQVIVNGFRKCGLYPFDEEAIDYTKCSNEIILSADQETSETAQHVANHRYLEQLIGTEVITAFNANNTSVIREHAALFGLWEKSQHFLTRPVAESVDHLPGASASPYSTAIESTDDDLLMLNDNPKALDIQRINERSPETIAAVPDNPEILNINPAAGKNTESIPVLDAGALKSELSQILSPETNGKDVPSPFKNNLFWPLPPKSSNVVRRKVKLPAVVTSEKWRAYEESQIRKKAEEERLKDERKKAREMKKQEKKNKNITKRRKKDVEFESSESEMEEEYLPGPQQDTSGDECICTDSEDELNHINKRKPEIHDFILVKFETKKISRHYVGEVLLVEESQVKTKFLRRKGLSFHYPAVDDISYIDISDILTVLPKPNSSCTARTSDIINFRYNLSAFNVM